MKKFHSLVAITVTVVALCVIASSQHTGHESVPRQDAGKAAEGHAGGHDGVNRRGDLAMGFSHTKTAHHFLLKKDGGLIKVEANDSNDTESRDRIRTHLAHIAEAFREGNFRMPMFIHDQTPPGVSVMTRLKSEIAYRFEETERGGLVRISTGNAEALSAIHDFLRFQITDHKTGDPLEVQ